MDLFRDDRHAAFRPLRLASSSSSARPSSRQDDWEAPLGVMYKLVTIGLGRLAYNYNIYKGKLFFFYFLWTLLGSTVDNCPFGEPTPSSHANNH